MLSRTLLTCLMMWSLLERFIATDRGFAKARRSAG